jgi:hypothetical protein
MEKLGIPVLPGRREKRKARRKEHKELVKAKKIEEHRQDLHAQRFFTPHTIYVPNISRANLSTISYHEDGVLVVKSKMGWSLRALRIFERGNFITQYRGSIVNRSDLASLEEGQRTHLLSLRGGQWIDGIKEPRLGCGAGSFANHSVNPNCEFHKSEYGAFLRATRRIEPGGWIQPHYGSHKGHTCLNYA